MDTITQALLGAACGNVCARHKLGKRAARWGAVGGALPDLDVIAALVGGPWAEMTHHRGVTHALWFAPLFGGALGWLVWRRYARLRSREPEHVDAELGAIEQRRWWILVLVVAVLSHPLLDIFTTYGTQIFTPFSSYRATVNAIGVVDPVYTIPFVVALLRGKSDDVRVKVRASWIALGVTTLYLFYGLWINHRARDLAVASLAADGVTDAEVRAYPQVLQIFGRRLVARRAIADAGDELFVGQVSMFAPRPIRWHRFTEAHGALVERTLSAEEGQLFSWFAMHQTAAHLRTEGDETVIEIHDMRYGDVSDPEYSMWGIRARYRDGALVEDITRFRRGRQGGIGAAFSRMMRDTFNPP